MIGAFPVPLAVTVVAVTACIARPGRGVDVSFASQYGCDHEWIQRRAEELKQDLDWKTVDFPEVGWDACELMAHHGRPEDIDHLRLAPDRDLQQWSWHSDEGLRSVTLELYGDPRAAEPLARRRSGWIVTAVNW